MRLSASEAAIIKEYNRRFSVESPWCPVSPHPKQKEFINLTTREALYGGAGGGGKALALDTPIPTPFGWTTMGDLRPGDLVFGIDGIPTSVVATASMPLNRACYRITFDDGEQITADAEHLWLTYNEKELMAATRCTDKWRTKRRENRKSRALGNKSEKFKKSISKRNKDKKHKYRTETGSIKTTQQIFLTSERPHAVPLAAALVSPQTDLPMDPYLLGLWLGDGTSSSGLYTSADEELPNAFRDAGFKVKNTKKHHYYISGFVTKLRLMGLIGNKKVPDEYLRSSYEQRLSLLQGLMDTDGCCDKDGRVEFCNTNKSLAYSAFELAISLGVKATIKEGRAKLNGRDCGPKWRVCWTSDLPVFRLQRKVSRLKKDGLRRTTKMRYMVKVEPVPSVPVKCIQVNREDGMYLAGRHMVPTHNSFCLLMIALEHVDKPHYRALILRRTYKALNKPGALMDIARSWLSGTDAKWSHDDKSWTFPSGAVVTFGYLDHNNDLDNYQGSAYHTIIFDELTQFTKYQYMYLRSRNRRVAGDPIALKIRGASNPGGIGHDWVFDRFIARPEGKRIYVPAKIDDNPSLDREEYKETLKDLDPIRRAQLLEGEWIKDESTVVVPYDESINGIDEFVELPKAKYILGIDLGASSSKKTTAFCLMMFSYQTPNLVVGVECEAYADMIPTTIAAKIREYQQRYDIMRVVMDIGALGVGYSNEIQRRHAIPITPAKKSDKLGYINLLKGDMRLGRVKFVKNSTRELIDEFNSLIWKDERQLEMVGRKNVDDDEKGDSKTPSNHNFDACLYAWRECRHWQAVELEKAPALGTKERDEWEERKMFEESRRLSKEQDMIERRSSGRRGLNVSF